MSFRTCSQYFLQTLTFLSCGALRPTTNSTYDGPGGRVRISEEGTREKAPLLENSVPTSEKVSMDVPEGRPSISGSRELSTALEHARRAVQLDTDGLIPQAVEEYNKTAELLDELLGMAGEVGEAERVKMIVSGLQFFQGDLANVKDLA